MVKAASLNRTGSALRIVRTQGKKAPTVSSTRPAPQSPREIGQTLRARPKPHGLVTRQDMNLLQACQAIISHLHPGVQSVVECVRQGPQSPHGATWQDMLVARCVKVQSDNRLAATVSLLRKKASLTLPVCALGGDIVPLSHSQRPWYWHETSDADMRTSQDKLPKMANQHQRHLLPRAGEEDGDGEGVVAGARAGVGVE